MKISQSNELAFQLITIAAQANAASQGLTNTVHEIWYLLGYPDPQKQAVDNVPNNLAAATSGTANIVTVFAAQRFPGSPLAPQQGVWVWARIPTVVAVDGMPVLDANMLNDGYLRLVYDFTANEPIINRFHNLSQLQFFQAGKIVFNVVPDPSVVPIPIPTVPVQSNAYTPQGLHFNGATGLVTAQPIVTKNTGIISFAGWFNLDPSLSGQLEFSQGSGSNTLSYDTTLPAVGWCHQMGTIDAGANMAFLMINGSVASGNPTAAGTAFSSAPTNGTNVYIGTDNQGNFYKGDIADLSIWFDYSFLVNGTIPLSTLAALVLMGITPAGATQIQPVNPSFFQFGRNTLKQPFEVQTDNILTLRQPDIFLSGPAGSALNPHTPIGTPVQTIQSLSVVSGGLTNSSTNPGTIVIRPV